MPADPNKIFEITITSFIKVNYEDDSENFEELFKNQTKALNNNKLLVGNQMRDRKFYKTIGENPAVLSMSKEEEYTSIVAENGAHRIASCVASAVIFSVFRLLV